MIFFINDTATTEIYTLTLHDALPIWRGRRAPLAQARHELLRLRERELRLRRLEQAGGREVPGVRLPRSEEHTSELQSRQYLVCRLLLVKKKSLTRKPSCLELRHVDTS